MVGGRVVLGVVLDTVVMTVDVTVETVVVTMTGVVVVESAGSMADMVVVLVVGLLLDEPDGRNAAVLVGVVELRYGAVELLDVSVPFSPGMVALHTSRMSRYWTKR